MNLIEKNLTALRKRDPGLETYILKYEPKRIKLTETLSQAKEASQYVLINSQGLMLLMGFGNGGYALELLKRCKPGRFLLVYEPDPASFRHALSLRDFSEFLLHPSLILMVGDIKDFSFMAMIHETIVNGNLFVIKNKGAIAAADEEAKKQYDKFYERFMEEKKFWDVNVGTQLNIGKSFIESIMQNVPSIVKSRSYEALRNVAPGVPAIVISTGPSLDGEIENLRKAKGRALLIAIDTSWPILEKHGIKPDLIAGIDPLDDNEALFKVLPECPFVCMSQYTPTVVKRFLDAGKPVYIAGQPGNPMYEWLHYFWEDKGAGESFGGSVAHFAFGIAEHMGCTSIGLIGQDLCFKNKIHAGDVTKQLHDYKGLEVPDETIDAMKAKNKMGEEVCTKQNFLSFKLAFENKIRFSPHLSVANMTQEGLHIEGAYDITFDEFLEECPESFAHMIANTDYDPVFNIHALVERLDEGIRVYTRVRRATLLILRLIHKAKRAREKKNTKEVYALTKKIEELRPHTQNGLLAIMGAYHYHLELYLRRKDIQDIDAIKDKWRRYDQQLDRGLNFYGELEEGVRLFLAKIKPVRDQIKEEYAHQLKRRPSYIGGSSSSQGPRNKVFGCDGEFDYGGMRQVQF